MAVPRFHFQLLHAQEWWGHWSCGRDCERTLAGKFHYGVSKPARFSTTAQRHRSGLVRQLGKGKRCRRRHALCLPGRYMG